LGKAERKKQTFDVSLLKRVLQFTRPYRKQFIVSVVLAVLLAAITPLRPFFIQYTVDHYIAHANTSYVDVAIRALVQITIFQIADLTGRNRHAVLFFLFHHLAGTGRSKRYPGKSFREGDGI
jgi:ABC-type multidrug transport system fused ATPase/permease subunit